MADFCGTQWFMGGKFLWTSKQPYLLIYDLNWKKEKKWKEQKLSLGEGAQRVSALWRLQQVQGQNGWRVVWHGGSLSNIAMQVDRKPKVSVWSYDSSPNHRKGISPGICLIAGITLHLIRYVKKVKLAKIISQLFCSLRGSNSSFKWITVLLRKHMQTHTKSPAWGFWSFSVVISSLHYSSVGAAERRAEKANANTGKSRKNGTVDPLAS